MIGEKGGRDGGLLLAQLARFEHIARAIGAAGEHGFVHLHAEVVGLPVEGDHLDAAFPEGQGVRVGGFHAEGGRVDAHEVPAVVLFQLAFRVGVAAEVLKGLFGQREDVVVGLAVGVVEVVEFEAASVDAEGAEGGDDLALFACRFAPGFEGAALADVAVFGGAAHAGGCCGAAGVAPWWGWLVWRAG